MKKNEYKCAMCEGVFTKGWSEEEVKKEAEEIWGKEMATHVDMATICDDCFQKMNPKAHPEKVTKTKEDFYSKRN